MPEPTQTGSEELVLAFLAEAADEVVSGEAISDKLGLTRAAVWKHVEALRGQGYRIDAVASRGYRLVAVPDRLRALELRPLLNTHDVGKIHVAASTPSKSQPGDAPVLTNPILKNIAPKMVTKLSPVNHIHDFHSFDRKIQR